MTQTVKSARRNVAAAKVAAVQPETTAIRGTGATRWLKMEMGLSGPIFSLSRGDKRQFCDEPAADGGPSEAQRLIDAGIAVDTDAPAEA